MKKKELREFMQKNLNLKTTLYSPEGITLMMLKLNHPYCQMGTREALVKKIRKSLKELCSENVVTRVLLPYYGGKKKPVNVPFYGLVANVYSAFHSPFVNKNEGYPSLLVDMHKEFAYVLGGGSRELFKKGEVDHVYKEHLIVEFLAHGPKTANEIKKSLSFLGYSNYHSKASNMVGLQGVDRYECVNYPPSSGSSFTNSAKSSLYVYFVGSLKGFKSKIYVQDGEVRYIDNKADKPSKEDKTPLKSKQTKDKKECNGVVDSTTSLNPISEYMIKDDDVLKNEDIKKKSFKQDATQSVRHVIKEIQKLRALSDSKYCFDEEQVIRIFCALSEEIEALEKRFYEALGSTEKEEFSL